MASWPQISAPLCIHAFATWLCSCSRWEEEILPLFMAGLPMRLALADRMSGNEVSFFLPTCVVTISYSWVLSKMEQSHLCLEGLFILWNCFPGRLLTTAESKGWSRNGGKAFKNPRPTSLSTGWSEPIAGGVWSLCCTGGINGKNKPQSANFWLDWFNPSHWQTNRRTSVPLSGCKYYSLQSLLLLSGPCLQ